MRNLCDLPAALKALALAMIVMVGGPAAAQALTPVEQAVLDDFRLHRQQQDHLRAADRASRLMGQIMPSYGCVSGPVATIAPLPTAITVTVPSATVGKSFQLTYWRVPCENDETRSAVLFRATRVTENAGGSAWICGGGFRAIQNGQSYDTLSVPNGGFGICNFFHTDQTFILGQFSHLDQFDGQQEFSVSYIGSTPEGTAVTIPAYVGRLVPENAPLQLGWWYNPAEAGRGWGIGRNGDKLFLGGFLYEADGRPSWMISNLGLVSTGATISNGTTVVSALYQGDLIYCRDGLPLEMMSGKPPNCATAGSVTLATAGSRAAWLTISRTGAASALATPLVPFDNF